MCKSESYSEMVEKISQCLPFDSISCGSAQKTQKRRAFVLADKRRHYRVQPINHGPAVMGPARRGHVTIRTPEPADQSREFQYAGRKPRKQRLPISPGSQFCSVKRISNSGVAGERVPRLRSFLLQTYLLPISRTFLGWLVTTLILFVKSEQPR